jgi:hypothetical protein
MKVIKSNLQIVRKKERMHMGRKKGRENETKDRMEVR